MDESIRKEPGQLPDKEAAQVGGGTIGPDVPITFKYVRQCEKCSTAFTYFSMCLKKNCPYCGGKLVTRAK